MKWIDVGNGVCLLFFFRFVAARTYLRYFDFVWWIPPTICDVVESENGVHVNGNVNVFEHETIIQSVFDCFGIFEMFMEGNAGQINDGVQKSIKNMFISI